MCIWVSINPDGIHATQPESGLNSKKQSLEKPVLIHRLNMITMCLYNPHLCADRFLRDFGQAYEEVFMGTSTEHRQRKERKYPDVGQSLQDNGTSEGS
eukprot:2708064-Ditylum_brightwellii.AAC.1